MATNYFRSPMPYWHMTDNVGHPLANGRLYTFAADTRQAKSVFKDPGGLNPWTPYVPLDGQGNLPTDVYWADDEKYYIEFRTSAGVVVNAKTLDNFPYAGEGGGGTSQVLIDAENKLINGQFRFHKQAEYDPTPDDEIEEVAYGWEFYRDNDSAEDRLAFERFPLGSDDPPYTPIYNLRYVCTGAGSSEQEKWLRQKFTDVRSFEGEEITISFEAQTDTPRQVELQFEQNFGDGDGASDTIITPIGDPIELDVGYTKYHRTFTVPSVGGNTRDGSDFAAIRFQFPLDSVCDIRITSFQLNMGDIPHEYEYKTYEEESALVSSGRMPVPSKDDRGKSPIVNNQAQFSLERLIPIGTLLEGFWRDNPDEFLYEWADGRTLTYSENDGKYQKFFETVTPFLGGRGRNGFTCEHVDNRIVIAYTSTQSIDTAADGDSATGFSFQTLMPYDGSGPAMYSNIVPGALSTGYFFSRDAENPNAFRNGPQILNEGMLDDAITINNSKIHPAIVQGLLKEGSNINGGDSFRVFGDNSSFLTVWASVDGGGSQPSATTEHYREVKLKSNDSKETAAIKVLHGLDTFQIDEVETVGASTLSGGEYWLINSETQNYYVWYEVNGQGSDPKVAGLVGIKIELEGNESAADVAQKTSDRLKKEFFQTPDTRLMFLRGWGDENEMYGPRRDDTHFHYFPHYEGDQVREHDHSHSHTYNRFKVTEPGIGIDGDVAKEDSENRDTSTDATENKDYNHGGSQQIGRGGHETRPIDLSAKRLVKIN